MIKLTLVFFVSFWLSCGNTPQTAQNKTTVSEANSESAQTVSTDTLLSTESALISEDIEAIAQDKKIDSSDNQVFEQEEGTTKPVVTVLEKKIVEEKRNTKPEHTQWNALLKKYVNDAGDVNYKGFLNDVNSLDEYLNYLAENSPEKEWSKNEKLAYYINLYNAATVKLILNNYPTRSIKDIKNPWGKSWIKTGDGILSLGAIEHKILRKMNEPRIHFAINCASFSCPKLLNKAFTSDQMENQLHQVTVGFINDPTQNKIAKEKLELSNIFKWYKKDFVKNSSLVAFIKPYTKIEIKPNADIDYLKYNWNLNEAK